MRSMRRFGGHSIRSTRSLRKRFAMCLAWRPRRISVIGSVHPSPSCVRCSTAMRKSVSYSACFSSRDFSTRPGMRMDLVVNATENDPAQVIELKRGSHRLLVCRGTPVERVSEPLIRALRQVRTYGARLESDAETRFNVEGRHTLELDKLELRLVAGRQLPTAASYHLLSQVAATDGLELHISTWDGFLAEIERIAAG